jgi:tetratricopeptide (TPR) repeat protein
MKRVLVSSMLALALSAAVADAQEARKAFEAGKYQAVVEQVSPDADPASVYLRGLSLQKLGQNDQAKEAFDKLAGGGDTWKAIGESASALIDGNQDGALQAAERAAAAEGAPAEAQYQLGLALGAHNEQARAAAAFEKATQASPDMAYAHYQAGMAYYKAKQVDKMAVFFENFLRLAPQAPEKPAVEAVMRTVRGR